MTGTPGRLQAMRAITPVESKTHHVLNIAHISY